VASGVKFDWLHRRRPTRYPGGVQEIVHWRTTHPIPPYHSPVSFSRVSSQCLPRTAKRVQARRAGTCASREAAILPPACLALSFQPLSLATLPTSDFQSSPFEPLMILLSRTDRLSRPRKTWKCSWTACGGLWRLSRTEEWSVTRV
jgi:hypothetical protein